MASKLKSPVWRKLLARVRPHLLTLFLGLLALAGGSAVNLLIPEIVRRLLNSEMTNWFIDHPIEVGLGLVGLFAAQGLCFFFRSYLFGVVGQKVENQLRKDLYAATIRQKIEFFDTNRVGDLVSRLSSDTLLIRDAVSTKISVLIRYILQVVVGVVLMLFISATLTLAIVLILPLIVGLSITLGKKLKRLSKLQQSELGTATTIAEETFSGARIVQAFGREPFESDRYDSASNRVLSAGLRRAKVAAFFASFVSFLMNAAIIFVLVYGIQLVAGSTLTYGDLTAFVLYGVIVAVSFAFIAGAFADFLQAVGAGERVFEVLERSLPLATRSEPVALPMPCKGEITFDSVSFAYPVRPDVPVLQDTEFTIRPGKSTALVGPSGAGKSTVVNLILRFYDPLEGSISFDGIDLRDIPFSHLRDQIAIVPQEPDLFAVSIAENLRYGKADASAEELREVCERANIMDFVGSLPEGLNTNVGHRGIQLSGGQKQRIAIARAMLKDPALLILDEATSALDSEIEHLVQQALKLLMADRTALIIAHRLSTIKNADQVIVLDKGVIAQVGEHESLSQQSGLYQQLVQRQELFGPEVVSEPC